MKILITGITGLLGYALQRVNNTTGELTGIYYPERQLPIHLQAKVYPINVIDYIAMEKLFEIERPEIVIHTSGIGNVDYAEKYKEITREINVGGTKVICELCERWNSRLIYISSNAVFDGSSPFYNEDDMPNPINYYGQLKVEAEEIVKKCHISWTIVRPILMYGWPYPGERENLVTIWLKSLREGKEIKAVNNVFSKPLFSDMCAKAIYSIIEKNKSGIFHIAGRDHVSLYEFALKTADIFGLDRALINPVPDSYFSDLVKRPKDTSFNTEKMERELEMIPISLVEGLTRMKNQEKILL